MPDKATKILTERRRSILEFIADHIDEHGYAPTLAEIGEHESIDQHAIYRHLGVLEGAGYISRKDNTARAITVHKHPDDSDAS